MSRLTTCAAALIVGISLLNSSTRAEWQAPKDGVFTEKQLVSYIETLKDLMDQWKAMGKRVEENKGNAAAIAMLAQADTKFDALLTKHGLSRPEWEWMGNQATTAYGMVMADEATVKMQADFAAQGKQAETDLIEARKKQTDYEAATKAGSRVLTKDQRDSLIKDATDQQQSINEEIKQHTDEAKAISDEATKAETDAKTADGLAKSPPADVSKDDREEYVKARQADAETARNTSKEARDRETEAKKAVADAKTRLAIAIKKATHPETPLTDEEKAQVKEENAQGVVAAKEEVARLTQGIAAMKEVDAQMKKTLQEQAGVSPIQNRELMKKHMAEFTTAFGAEQK